ncbi:hypothetical protein LEP1GSC041_1448 [Leptospira noguchii str. 2006001870]|uniref:hypothetical protein n=1 Tax=Leptospira noguchii TaxID=28182 RepID=UPI000248B1BE|nr:hypothetical protein [Leptospira noguchii]EKR73176.1 hypothetical protein LEP1GSC041_1448 [Leptospira noguchii str. 2006001870]
MLTENIITKEAILERHKQRTAHNINKSIETRIVEFLKDKKFKITGLGFPENTITLTLEIDLPNTDEDFFISEDITSILIDAHGGIN